MQRLYARRSRRYVDPGGVVRALRREREDPLESRNHAVHITVRRVDIRVDIEAGEWDVVAAEPVLADPAAFVAPSVVAVAEQELRLALRRCGVVERRFPKCPIAGTVERWFNAQTQIPRSTKLHR